MPREGRARSGPRDDGTRGGIVSAALLRSLRLCLAAASASLAGIPFAAEGHQVHPTQGRIAGVLGTHHRYRSRGSYGGELSPHPCTRTVREMSSENQHLEEILDRLVQNA